MVRAVIPIVVLDSLWKTIQEEANRRDMSISRLFETAAQSLIRDPQPLPIEPNRRITKYGKKEQFEEEFPSTRHSLSLDPAIIQQLFTVYEAIDDLDLNTVVHTVCYYFAKSLELEVDENYFDDVYFKQHYTYSEQETLQSLRDFVSNYGHSPTAKEWKEKQCRPSWSYIKSRFGSFNKAKELAGIEIFKRRKGAK